MTHKRVTSVTSSPIQQNGNSHLHTQVAPSTENVKKENDSKLFRWRALMTIGGLYGLTVSVMGIVVPFTYFVSLWAEHKDVYFYLFYGYVFLLSLAFMIYTSVMAYRLRNKTTELNMSHQFHKDLPCIMTTHEGINVYLIFALIVFGGLSMVFHVLILISYNEDPLQFVCYGSGQIAISSLIILFVLCQMIFLLIHSKTIFNFNPMLMKIGLMHLIAANMCTWGLAVLFEAAEVYLHSMKVEEESTSQNTDAFMNTTSTTQAISHTEHGDFVSRCLALDTIAVEASPYLMPFFVEFSLICVSVLYKILQNVGTRPQQQHLVLVDNKYESLLRSEPCIAANPVSFLNSGLRMATVALTVTFILIHEGIIEMDSNMAMQTTYFLYFGTQYILLAIALVVTIGAAYYTNKCHYIRHNPDSFFDEMLLLLALGGFYFLLAFVIIASCYLSINPAMSPMAELYIFWTVINYVQATIQVIFIRDGLRRRALTKSCLTSKPARAWLSLTACSNECLWIVMSFMLKEITSSRTMTSFYSSLTWVIISSIFLPLAIFFRFHSGSCISDVIEVLYHNNCYIGNRRVNAQHWTTKDT